MKRLVLALAFAALPVARRSLGRPDPGAHPAAPPGPAPDYNAGGLPRVPTYGTVEGQPIDARVPEKKADTRQFPEQTRAPYHHPTDFKMTVLTNQLHAAWASALLPDGKLLVTERLPGAFRIVGKAWLSAPLKGLEGLHVSTPMTGLLDVVLDPDFASNHTIYFTYFEYLDKIVYNTAIARAVLDEAGRRHPRREGAAQDLALRAQRPDPWRRAPRPAGASPSAPTAFSMSPSATATMPAPRPWPVAQYLDTHLGKVMRITKDGKPAPGNPFIGHAGRAAGNLGHRLAQPGRPGLRARRQAV